MLPFCMIANRCLTPTGKLNRDRSGGRRIDEWGRLKGGYSGSSVVVLREGVKRLHESSLPASARFRLKEEDPASLRVAAGGLGCSGLQSVRAGLKVQQSRRFDVHESA
jgi:hypothetical protein